jgi:hypothetical protein
MQLVVSSDYLISPAYCSKESLPSCVESLIFIKRDLDNGSSSIVIEENSLDKLEEIGYYPCAQMFNHHLKNIGHDDYCGKEIARTVHNILIKNLGDDSKFPVCVADWNNKLVEPMLEGRSQTRNEALVDLLENISLSIRFFDKNYSMLHHPTCEGNSVTFTGEVVSILPENDDELPQEIKTTIQVLKSYQMFTVSQNTLSLYNAATDENAIKSAFLVGANAVFAQRGVKRSALKLEDFSLGEKFIESLDTNQCAPTQKYSGTTFDVICHALAGIGKNSLDPFWKDTTRKEQRSRANGDLAWRTHITKGNPTLRLMYWKNDVGHIELANIGKKNDVEIF